MNDHIEVLRGLVAELREDTIDWSHNLPDRALRDFLGHADRLDAALAALSAQPEAQAAEIGPEWTPCRKRPVVVHVREQRPGEQHVSTREGITPIKPDDLIMRGVAGEEYPIGRDLFAQTYDLVGDKQAEAQAVPAAWIEGVATKISSYGLSIEAARVFAQSEVEEYLSGQCDCAEMAPADMCDVMMDVAMDAVEKWKKESVGRPFGYKPTTPPPGAVPEGISGELVEMGDDDEGNPRLVIATTREAIKAFGPNLMFKRVTVAAAPGPKENNDG